MSRRDHNFYKVMFSVECCCHGYFTHCMMKTVTENCGSLTGMLPEQELLNVIRLCKVNVWNGSKNILS